MILDMIKNININMIRSITKRDLKLYFSNPTGYVFITLFIFLSASAAFWQERFFMNNLANLDLLNGLFPLILMFFIPALTMGVWADEKRQGTDELLFTLPATDLEIVLGKYLAVLGMYTVSLVLSLSHIFVLFWLGEPDLGLMFGNYVGFWLLGAAFIAVGMLASLLASNVTISFILGVLFCAVFGYIDSIFGVLGESVQSLLQPLGIFSYFDDFARGIISFSGKMYFFSIIFLAIYMNVILVGRRHWPLKADGYKMWMHHALRIGAIVIALISFNVMVNRIGFRIDVTAEQMHSLSDETDKLMDEIPSERTVFIQAYISKEVPQHMVQTRSNLVGTLKEIGAAGGSKVEVMIYDTEPFSDEAKDAREKFGIFPREVQNPGSGRASTSKIFMGVAFTSGAVEEVIPFFERGLPVEYEISRSIRVVAKSERRKIGVVTTPLKLFGGFDFQTMNSQPGWQVVDELKKQYEVIEINPAEPITGDFDGMLVALPSSLPQPSMDNVMAAIRSGVPTLILADPLPLINVGLAPMEKAGGSQNPFQQQQGPPPPPKGNINAFMTELGINLNIQNIVWDGYNPHPSMSSLPPEIVFVGDGNDRAQAFNQDHIVSSGLQEVVLMFPGAINKLSNSIFTFTPLLKSGTMSGIQPYRNIVRQGFFGPQLVTQGLPHRPLNMDYTLAAHIQQSDSAGINAIVVADIDFISEQFFEIRKQGVGNFNFDNVNFFLNSMDVLIKDESFVNLRKRRVRHRTLAAVESRTQEYVAKRAIDEQKAEQNAQVALQAAQNRLNQKVGEVRQRVDLDENTKNIMAKNLQEVENKRFEAMKANIEAEKAEKVQQSEEEMETQIRGIQSSIKIMAVLFPPIPVIIFGIMIFLKRRKKEDEGASIARRLRS